VTWDSASRKSVRGTSPKEISWRHTPEEPNECTTATAATPIELNRVKYPDSLQNQSDVLGREEFKTIKKNWLDLSCTMV
jgi:hypothetical protein